MTITTITREQLKSSEQPYIEAANYYLNNKSRRDMKVTVYGVADEKGLDRERLQATIDHLFHFRYVCR